MPDIVNNTILLRSMLDFLPPCFNIDPEKELAFIIEASGSSVTKTEIKDLFLQIWLDNNLLPSYRFSLEGKTISEIAAEVNSIAILSVDGGDIEESALRLVPEISTDGRIYMFTSVLWAIFQAFALELGELLGGIKEGLRQLSVPGATDMVQDYWGTYFKINRRRLEADANYGQRILMTVQIPKSNNVAIEELLRFTFGLNTTVLDLGYSVGSFMLMNDVTTPMYSNDWYLWNIGMGPAEPCTFGIVLEPGAFAAMTQETFYELKHLIYAVKESGTRPKLIFTDQMPFMLMNDVTTPMYNVNWPLAMVFQRYNQYFAMFI